MARPIPLDLPPRDPRVVLQMRLRDASAQHAEELLAGYEVLQRKKDRGEPLFRMIRRNCNFLAFSLTQLPIRYRCAFSRMLPGRAKRSHDSPRHFGQTRGAVTNASGS